MKITKSKNCLFRLFSLYIHWCNPAFAETLFLVISYFYLYEMTHTKHYTLFPASIEAFFIVI